MVLWTKNYGKTPCPKRTFFRDSRYDCAMRDSRAGEFLWNEWTGEGYEPTNPDAELFFFTEEHVDVEHEVVRRALASALQRDGSVVSLGQGFSSLESSTVVQGFAGYVDESLDLYLCDEYGETQDGDYVDQVIPITWVEI
jgi:hypothetical protein